MSEATDVVEATVAATIAPIIGTITATIAAPALAEDEELLLALLLADS